MNLATLKAHYERQLVADLDRPELASHERADAGRILTATCHLPPGAIREPDHRVVWIWADLHLGHSESIEVFGRPFATADDMDDALFGNWHRLVQPDDAILCLGDLAIHGVSGRLLKRLREAPGWKILIVGNHDVGCRGIVDIDAFDEVYGTVYSGGTPELLLTHVPVREIPEGCVNVHGHLHRGRVAGGRRYINACVEQLGYSPRPLTQIRRLALRLVRGEVVSGDTTADQLEDVSAVGGPARAAIEPTVMSVGSRCGW